MYLVKTGSLPSRCYSVGIQWEEKREESKDKKLHLKGDNTSVGHHIGAQIAFIRALLLGERWHRCGLAEFEEFQDLILALRLTSWNFYVNEQNMLVVVQKLCTVLFLFVSLVLMKDWEIKVSHSKHGNSLFFICELCELMRYSLNL